MRKLDARKLAREKSLFRYSSALERADFATVEAVLREAERDPVLAQMITEINMVYESETIRLSPSLNHSSNHQQKELLMTTIILPRRQNTIQRWLPITLAAACVSVLFIGALLMRPIRPGGSLVGLQVQASATPTAAASPTLVPTEPPTFTPTPVPAAGVVEPSALPPTVVPPDAQPSIGVMGIPVCGGSKLITEDTLVHAQPSNNSVAIGRIPLGTKAETLATGLAAEGDTSVPRTQWLFIKAEVGGNSVQGWVSANIAQPLDPANPCPSSDVAVLSEVVPANAVPLPTVVPANDIPFATILPTIVPPSFSAAAVPVCSAITLEGTTLHVINQVDKAATIYAAPLTINSNASVVGELPAKAEATLLYQQYDRQSDPIGALWYLIMTNGEGDKQITGWISANSLTASDSCESVATNADATSATAAIAPVQLNAITGVAMTSSAQTGTCHVINMTAQPATVFAAPLTADSNATVIGTLPAKSDAVVIFQNYDMQSAPIGALWYLVTVNGTNEPQVTGWVSANSINAANICAPEQLVGVSVSPVTFSTGTVSPIPVPNVDVSAPSMCQITNSSGKAATMFAAPLTANSNAPAVGEFAAGSDAVVILQNYDRKSDPIGALWYLITVNDGSDKQLTGWISANSINSTDACATEVIAGGVSVPANAQTQASVAPSSGDSGVAAAIPLEPMSLQPGICHIINGQADSIPVFSGPSSDGSESSLVNNLASNIPATVLYQQRNKRTGEVWYLMLVGMEPEKQISGWVNANNVKMLDACPAIP